MLRIRHDNAPGVDVMEFLTGMSDRDAMMLTAFANCLRAKDDYTYQHCENVAHHCMGMAKKMGLSDHSRRSLCVAAYLHDIGKIGIGDSILKKAGSLSDDEYQLVCRHPVVGEDMVSFLPDFTSAAKIIRHHHERCDGMGYPDKLCAGDIPSEAKIIAVADAFDAMTTRGYGGKAKTKQEALDEIIRCAGKQFDAEIADSFIHIIN